MEQIGKAFPDDSYQAYSNGDQMILYSLKPEGRIENQEEFHGYTVLGKTEIKDEKHRFLLKRALTNAMTGADGAACFNPRHGMRIINGNKTVDLVICFECGHFETYYEGKKAYSDITSSYAESLFNSAVSKPG